MNVKHTLFFAIAVNSSRKCHQTPGFGRTGHPASANPSARRGECLREKVGHKARSWVLVGACAVQGLDQSLSFGDSVQVFEDIGINILYHTVYIMCMIHHNTIYRLQRILLSSPVLLTFTFTNSTSW